MAKQNQEVGADAIAVQAQGDATVRVGMDAGEVQLVIHSAFESALPMYRAVAEEIAAKRMEELEARIVQQLSSQQTTRREALEDPDFQYLLISAHHAYARSGTEQVADTLVDLIARRAAETQRTRMALSINTAVQTCARLTNNEFAELSLCFLLRYARSPSVNNKESLARYLVTALAPFLGDISRSDSSYSYLVGESCAQLEITDINFFDIMRHSYGGVLSKGSSTSDWKDVLEDHRHLLNDNTSFIPCLSDPSKVQINAVRKQDFDAVHSSKFGSQPIADKVWAHFQTTLSTNEEISNQLPMAREIGDAWNLTPLRRMTLTSVGLAIGHANAKRVAKLDYPLEVWIN